MTTTRCLSSRELSKPESVTHVLRQKCHPCPGLHRREQDPRSFLSVQRNVVKDSLKRDGWELRDTDGAHTHGTARTVSPPPAAEPK